MNFKEEIEKSFIAGVESAMDNVGIDEPGDEPSLHPEYSMHKAANDYFNTREVNVELVGGNN